MLFDVSLSPRHGQLSESRRCGGDYSLSLGALVAPLADERGVNRTFSGSDLPYSTQMSPRFRLNPPPAERRVSRIVRLSALCLGDALLSTVAVTNSRPRCRGEPTRGPARRRWGSLPFPGIGNAPKSRAVKTAFDSPFSSEAKGKGGMGIEPIMGPTGPVLNIPGEPRIPTLLR